MLRDQIYEDVKTAMKARDTVRLEAVRFVWSEIKRIEIDAKHELTDEEIVEMLRKEIKRRKDAIEQIKAGGREELVTHEQEQLSYIEAYVPQLMSESDVAVVVDEVMAGGEKDFGKVMGMVMGKLKGKADGKTVQEVVKKKLSR
jgi:uncharacterized protein